MFLEIDHRQSIQGSMKFMMVIESNSEIEKEAGRTTMALVINQKFCKGCSICIEFCPKQVLTLTEKGKAYPAQSELCIKCGQCELRCPDLAIRVLKEDKGG